MSRDMMRCRILSVVLVFLLAIQDITGQCVFPDWLQTSRVMGVAKGWITKREYYTTARYWREQTHIVVEGADLRYQKIEKQCETDIATCERISNLYTRSCVKEMGEDRYLVKHIAPGRGDQYLCIHVAQKTKNVLLVRTGPTSSMMEDSLCAESKLMRDDWPWISQDHKEWTFCPFIGGFEFHTFSYATQEDICPEEWRLSRVEVECMKGEGLNFVFPDGTCNPFWDAESTSGGPDNSTRLYCYGNWEEDGYNYVILNVPGDFPRYSMRLPTSIGGKNTDVYLYKGLVSPTTSDGRPPFGVNHYKMSMKRSDSSMCTDESDKCQEFARNGYCTSRPRYEYAQYCKRSCRICDTDSSGQPECRFPLHYQGAWKLYQSDRTEDTMFTDRHVFFGTLGKFVCKSKDFAESKYKLLSTFYNGCRPRYTCIEFSKPSDNLLQYRLSESKKMDLHFKKLCVFEDDPAPLGDLFRSKNMKILVTTSKLKPVNCNLYGVTPVNATLSSGDSCKGSISDWDPFKCNRGNQLTVTLERCPKRKLLEEYTCIARINPRDSERDSYLFTQSRRQDDVYNCWVIHRDPVHGKIMYKMPSPQCDDTSSQVLSKKKPDATYRLRADQRTQVCIDKTTEPQPTTPSSKGGMKSGTVEEPKDQGRTGDNRIGSKKDKIENPGSVRGAASYSHINYMFLVLSILIVKHLVH